MTIDIYRSRADGGLTVSSFPPDGTPPKVTHYSGPFFGDGQAPVMSEEQTQEAFAAAIMQEINEAMMATMAASWGGRTVVKLP